MTGLTGYAAYRMMNPEVSLRKYIEQRAAAIQAKQRQISCGTAQKVKAADPLGELTPKVPEIETKRPITADDVISKAVAEGSAKTKPLQEHHFATDKSKKYTSQFENIANKYGLDLDEPWNKEFLQHQGRHPYDYHEFVLDEMTNIDNIANGNREVFFKLFEKNVKSVIRENPDMLYKEYWLNQ